jgi:hypothetical protein
MEQQTHVTSFLVNPTNTRDTPTCTRSLQCTYTHIYTCKTSVTSSYYIKLWGLSFYQQHTHIYTHTNTQAVYNAHTHAHTHTRTHMRAHKHTCPHTCHQLSMQKVADVFVPHIPAKGLVSLLVRALNVCLHWPKLIDWNGKCFGVQSSLNVCLQWPK